MPDIPVLYTPQQAAEMLGLKESSVRRYIRLGQLEGIQINARGDWRVTGDAINAFIESRRNATLKQSDSDTG